MVVLVTSLSYKLLKVLSFEIPLNSKMISGVNIALVIKKDAKKFQCIKYEGKEVVILPYGNNVLNTNGIM